MNKITKEQIELACKEHFKDYENPIREDGTSRWKTEKGVFFLSKESTIRVLELMQSCAKEYLKRQKEDGCE